jgi:6-pyruvoyltetrahydropterin/6-carboxytetrahydropterin synthase
MKLYYSDEFDAAHFLPGHKGKCKNLHGHTWTVEIEVEGEPDPETGMIIDFGDLKNMVMQFDHQLINDHINVPPTAENLAKIIRDTIILNSNLVQVMVRVWESDHAYVEAS